ncbi:ferritin-like domain-containing protein [Metabacillus fastidiosus]|uniref:ferritin-like domain-containing protein n=1 Tax=Metabacillus fastidiosus TaxID=1458 RepID=UPI002E1D5F78|nr:ferritin-like domain-containing protein [Metabacillus fastidiosus]
MYHQFFSYDPRTNADLTLDIAKAIDGEYSAIACYKQLENLAPTQKEKIRIREIRKDEIKHYQAFTNIFTQLTGHQHTPKIKEQCPTIYTNGLESAFNDEQETVDFYLDIADRTNNQYIKDQFKRAAMDEQNHAVWFLYFLK